MVFITPSLAIKRPTYGYNKFFKNGRRPFKPEEYVCFAERTPLKLRNHVKAALTRREEVSCISEMLTLFACMKSNDFSEKECPSEMAAFRRCYYESQAQLRAKLAIEDPTDPIPYTKQLTKRQLNTMLTRYPQKIDL